MPSDPRYQLERVETDNQDLATVQENLQRVFEGMSSDTDDNESAASTAATGTGTAYTPAVSGDWASSGAPTTVAEALDKIAAALGPI